MKIIKTEVSDVYILEPQVFGDHRGWFMESWSKRAMEEVGLYYDFVQDNLSFSTQKGTIRGLHFQKGEYAQAKIVRCGKGSVLDVVVDLRKGSPTYKKWTSVVLSEENKRQLLVPRGYAHGFLTLTDEVEFAYKTDNYYMPQSEGSVRWDDPEIGVDWGITNPIVSEKDGIAPLFDENNIYFEYKKRNMEEHQ